MNEIHRNGASKARRTPKSVLRTDASSSARRSTEGIAPHVSPSRPPVQDRHAGLSGAGQDSEARRNPPSPASAMSRPMSTVQRGLPSSDAQSRAVRRIEREEEAEKRMLVRLRRQDREEALWQKGIVRVKSSADYTLLIAAMVLLVLGTVIMLSASYPLAVRKGYGTLYYFSRQAFFIVIGVAAMMGVWKLFPTRGKTLRPILALGIWGAASVLLVVVCFIGVSEGEAQRWIQIPGVPVTIQPSEIMKIGIVLILALYADTMQKRMAGARTKRERFLYNVIFPTIILGFSCGLVIIGKHLSGTMIIGAIGFFMVLVMVDRKCPFWWAPVFIAGMLVLAAGLYILIIPYAKTRFIGIFSPDSDRWQSMQSMYAVGSGGLFGVGLGQSRQKYSYLGAAHTDFIFAIWCEEFGFVGAIALIVLFFVFLWRGYRIASRARDTFSMLTAFGITTHIAVQLLGHMTVDTTFLNTGISLPFFSYGGSALIMLMFEVGLLLRISEHDYVSRAELEEEEIRRRAGLD